MKKRFFKGNFFLRFLCVLVCALTCVGTLRAVDWASLSEAPDAGQYYIYNVTKGGFLSQTGTGSASMVYNIDPAGATLFTLLSGTTTSISFDDNGTTRYLNKYGYQSEITDNPATITFESAGNGQYYLYLPGAYKDNTRKYYLDGYSGGNYNTTYRRNSFQCRNFVFITPTTYEAQKRQLYYQAIGEPTRGGSIKVSFAPIDGENPGSDGSASGNTEFGFIESVQRTVYFKAIPDPAGEDGLNWLFAGWKASPSDEDYVSLSAEYSKEFTVNSSEEASPTTLTMYAYFEKESADQAQLLKEGGEVITSGTFAEVLAAANNNANSQIMLLKNVEVTSTQTIHQHIKLDFNNYKLSGSVDNIIAISGGASVTFLDNSKNKTGGIVLSRSAESALNAVQITNGTLTIDKGLIQCENTSDDEDAVAVGVKIVSGTLAMNGGSINVVGKAAAYGVQVPNGATANLATGTISVTSNENAYGVLANGTTNVTWSIAINATTTVGETAVGVLVDHASANVKIDGGTIVAEAKTNKAYGIQVKQSTVEIGGSMVSYAQTGTAGTAYAVKQEGTGEVNVQTGRFGANNTQDVYAETDSKLVLSGGYYVHSNELDTYKATGAVLGNVANNTKFYSEGYRAVLTTGDNPNYVEATADGKYFSSLADAITYANNHDKEMTILVKVPECELPAGNYTIPAKATLLIPYKADQTSAFKETSSFTSTMGTNTCFCKLTLKSGVNIDVFGKIEASSLEYRGDAASPSAAPYIRTGIVAGAFGQMHMETGSHITLQSGAQLFAWGYITGSGEIDARNGSRAYEYFQIFDWPGGSNALDMQDNAQKVFIVNQYAIQNIEVPITFHPGSKEYTSTGVTAGSGLVLAQQRDIQIIGTGYETAMFLMDEAADADNTWVRKEYDAVHDRQKYTVNSAATLSSIRINMHGSFLFWSVDVDMDSKNYVLPITNNMTIHLKSGQLNISQEVSLLPGAEIVIDKQATGYIDEDAVLYIYDKDDWKANYTYYSTSEAQAGNHPDAGQGFTKFALYSPSWENTYSPRRLSDLVDAKLTLHGTMLVEGKLYTTATGGSINSTNEDAGTIQFVNAVADVESYTDKLYQGIGAESKRKPVTVNPARLQKTNGEYVSTKGAGANKTYCFIGDTWTDFEQVDCFVVDQAEEPYKYYAKPAEYVLLQSNLPDGDQLYHSADGTKDYILVVENERCQWWAVEDVEENDALVHCTHPDNDKYYYYYDDPDDNDKDGWKEKEFRVTWINPYKADAATNPKKDTLAVYDVDYKSMPKYLGTNPSRPMTDYYTYDFIGWLPEVKPVTDDAVYVAQFQQNDRKYLITFLDEDGSVLEEALWKMGDVPAPVNAPTPSGKKLVWEPLITAVNGDATYRATYTDIVLPAYQITFVNWNGDTLLHNDGITKASYSVATGSIPEYEGDTPTKPSLADVGFEFEGWMPDLAPVSENAIYTAKFREKPATYTITFKRAVGNEGVVIDPAETIQTLELGYGETPVCTSAQLPTKTSTAAEYYTLVWSPLITAVTGNATYTATGFAAHKNTCRLTVSAGANGQVRMADGKWKNDTTNVFDYGTSKQIEAKATTTGYSFKRWSDGNTTNPRTVTVNAAISLTAEFALNQYEITWNNEGGTLIEKTVVNYGVVPSHVAPTKATDASNTYSFAGWTPTPVAATTNTTYTATFNATPIEYTIRIVLNNGMNDIVYEGKHYDDPITIGTPVKASKNGVDYTFSHWTNSADENIGTTIPNVTQNEVYTAQYDTHINDLKAGNSEDANAKDLSLTETGMEAQSLIVEPAGTVNITGTVTVQNFILESNGSQSGQLLGSSADRLTINEHAYFDLTLNAQRRTWYAVAVPWAVDAENGISIKGGRKLVLGRDFDLVYYQGDVRASQGAGYQCWKYAEDPDGDKIMRPGRAYMMYFGSEIETIRFENYDDTPFDDAVLTVGQYAASEAGDANWNGVANPRTYHATLAAGGATYGYYLNNGRVDEYMVGEGEPTYKLVNLASFNAIVGKPLFIQAVNITPISTTPKIAAAPRRIREIEIEEGIETVYEVTFGAENSANRDNIFIQTVETKEDGYVIGQDLLKAGMSAKLPQMWINRYGKKLSVNTATPMNGVHDYPLVLNIPQAGDYTIAVEGTQGDTDALYLTKDGSIIWNLSYGAYSGSFEKGENTSYGLRVRKAPQTATGIDEALVDVQGETRKVLINDQVFIIRGEKVYSVDGQLVK